MTKYGRREAVARRVPAATMEILIRDQIFIIAFQSLDDLSNPAVDTVGVDEEAPCSCPDRTKLQNYFFKLLLVWLFCVVHI